MDAFSINPPDWTDSAVHAREFCCPDCGAAASRARSVWINRRSPVTTADYRRKWQEFYLCECDRPWWAWSSDRPPNDLTRPTE